MPIKLRPINEQVVVFCASSGIGRQAALNFAPCRAPEQLTFDKELTGFPAWSPDGKFIAFQMKRGDSTHFTIIQSEGETPEQLAFNKGKSRVCHWLPNGDKILFTGHDGFWNVRSVSRSTKKQQQLTDYKKLNSFVRNPSWSPFGNQVVYEYSETTGNIWIADLKQE